MKIERPQAVVPWIPSRHRYALFRLAAWLRLSQTKDEQCVLDDLKVLAIDRDQSTMETLIVAGLVWLTFACFLTELLSRQLVLVAAAAIAVPAAALLINAAVPFVAIFITPVLHLIGLPRGPHNINTNSTIMLMALTLAASYFALSSGWVRVPAWAFLICLALNGIAALVVFVLRKRIREAEARCVA